MGPVQVTVVGFTHVLPHPLEQQICDPGQEASSVQEMTHAPSEPEEEVGQSGDWAEVVCVCVCVCMRAPYTPHIHMHYLLPLFPVGH